MTKEDTYFFTMRDINVSRIGIGNFNKICEASSNYNFSEAVQIQNEKIYVPNDSILTLDESNDVLYAKNQGVKYSYT